MNVKVTHLRLERENTGSFMTYQLPATMTFDQAEDYVKAKLPGWDIINGSPENPDEPEEEEENDNEIHF